MVQIARPNSTTSTGGSFTGALSRHEALSDQLDTSYLYGSYNNYGHLSNLTDPQVSTGHIIWVRYMRSSGGTGSPTFGLYQGDPAVSATLITSAIFGTTADANVNVSITLTTAEADSITNYNDLYWYVSKTGGTSSSSIYEYWLEIPDAFTPTQISGLKAWYDFSDITTLFQDTARTSAVTTTGQIIKGVTDKSGAGKHLSEATNGPAYTTGVQAGRSAARFDGSNDKLSNTSITAATSFTVFITAMKRGGPNATEQALFSMGTNARLSTDIDDNNSMYLWALGEDGTNKVVPNGIANTWTAIAFRVESASSLRFNMNGGNAWVIDPNDGITTATAYYFGCSVASTLFGDYDLGEVFIYDSVLSDANMDKAIAYLDGRWDVYPGVTSVKAPLDPPVVRGRTAPVSGLSATSPASTQVGDLVIAITSTRDTNASLAHNLNTNWTNLASSASNGSGVYGYLSAKMIQATVAGAQSYQGVTLSGTTSPTSLTSLIVLQKDTYRVGDAIGGGSSGTTGAPESSNITMGVNRDWLYVTVGGWFYSTNTANTAVAPWLYGDKQDSAVASVALDLATSERIFAGQTSEDPSAWAQSAQGVLWLSLRIGIPRGYANDIDIIQRGQNSSTPGGGATTTIAVTPTAGGAGHLYLCAVGCTYNGGGSISSITGGGLTWSRVRDNASGASMCAIWQATGTLTTATITATFSSSNAYMRHIAVFEVLGTTTIGQQVYTAASPTGASSLGVTLGEFGTPQNRPFALAASFHTNDGTSSVLLAGDYEELHFFNGYDSLMEAGAGAYFGWVTGWSPDTQDPNATAYDQTGYGNQYIAITALELGTPWAQGPGFSTIVSNNNIAARSAGGRYIDYCQNGNLWTVLADRSGANLTWRFYYSTNQGLAWTESTGSAVGSGENLYIDATACALFIDKDDYAHFVYSGSGTGNAVCYRLGTPNGSRTSWTWGSRINLASNGGGAFNRPGIDVVAHREVGGTGWYVHIVWCAVNGSNYSDVNWTYLKYNSSHTVTNNVGAILWQPYITQSPLDISLDFRHTPTDPKVVQSSTPSLYWSATDEDGATGLYYQKIAWTGSTWSQGSIRTIDSNGQAGVPGQNQLLYDGTRVLLMHVRTSATEVWVEERDEADTTTGLLGNGNNVDAGFIANATMAYDSNQNIYLLAKAYPGYDYRKSTYNPGTFTWSPWTQVEPDDSYDGYASACLMRGPESFVPIGVVYEAFAPSPDQARFGTLLANTSAPAGTGVAEGWGIPIFTVAGVAPTVDTFYPSEDGHVRNVATGGTYATAWAGSGTFTVNLTNDGSGFMPWGQAGPTNPGLYEDFFAFDTSSIPDGNTIDSVVFSLNIFIDNTATVTNVCQVRAHTWTAPITSATFVTGANLSGKTLLATATSAPGSRFTAGAYKDFTSTGSFAGAINKTGLTQVFVTTDRMAAGTTPADDETIHPYYVEKGTTFRPKLVVTHHA